MTHTPLARTSGDTRLALVSGDTPWSSRWQRCGQCHGKLRLLGGFNRDGTPAKTREPSAFARFVKDNFSALRASQPAAAHRDLMVELGRMWREGEEAPSGGRGSSGTPARVDELAFDLERIEL